LASGIRLVDRHCSGTALFRQHHIYPRY
jgi:hypothetical protein